MEAHHPHHVTHKKKWTEYLLEFFMLFLAVFLGFIAENIRENIVEHEREKQYMESLIEDIQLDISDAEEKIAFQLTIEKRIDSLTDLFEKPDRNNFTGDIYFMSRRTTRGANLSYHDRTIQQLKNAGGLRLVRNRDLSNNIVLYDGQVRWILNQNQDETQIREKIRDLWGKIFNMFVYIKMETTIGDSVVLKKPENNPPLLTNDPEIINELLNQEQRLKGHYIITSNMEKKLIASGNNLISQIKKEYHLK